MSSCVVRRLKSTSSVCVFSTVHVCACMNRMSICGRHDHRMSWSCQSRPKKKSRISQKRILHARVILYVSVTPIEGVPINTPDSMQLPTPESGAASATSFSGVSVFKKGDFTLGLLLTLLLLTCLFSPEISVDALCLRVGRTPECVSLCRF